MKIKLLTSLRLVAIVSLVSIILGWTLYGIERLTNWKIMSDIIAGVDNNFYLKFYYDRVNPYSSKRDADSTIVIIDIHELSDDSIADALLDISRKNPAVVGIDKLFSNHTYSNNDKLLSALDSLGDKVVAIKHLKRLKDDSGLIKPEITRASFLSYRPNVAVGSARRRDFYSALDSLDIRNKDTVGVMFDYLVAQKSGFMNPCVKENLNRSFINYRNKEIVEYPARYVKELNLEKKIVLVGDLNSETQDIHVLPFKVNKYNTISGLRILAYSIDSMIAGWDGDFTQRELNRAYIKDYGFVSILLSLIIILLYTSVFFVFKWLNSQIKNKVLSIILQLFAPFILLGFEVLMILVCFDFTTSFFIVPNLLGLMFSVFCVSFVYEMLAPNE